MAREEHRKLVKTNMGKRLLIWAGVCIGLYLIAWFSPTVRSSTAQLERIVQDSIIKNDDSHPAREDFVFLGIDGTSMSLDALDPEVVNNDESLSLMQQSMPWDRRVYANLIDKLGNAGAKLIILDLVFDKPSNQVADQALSAAIHRNRDKVVLAAAFAPNADDNKLLQLTEPMEDLLGPIDNETAFGYANFWKSPQDGVIRSASFSRTPNEANHDPAHEDEFRYYSLMGAAAHQLGHQLPDEDKLFRLGRIKGEDLQRTYAPQSLYTVFVPYDWKHTYANGAYFKDKVIIIGAAAPILNDSHETSAGTVYGAQVHLHVLASIIDDTWYEKVAWYHPARWPFSFLFGAGFSLCFILFSKKMWWLIVGSVLALVLYFSAQYFFIRNGLSYSLLIMSMFIAVFSLVSILIYDGLKERAQRQTLHRHLRRSMSADLADAILRAPDGYYTAAAGNRKEVCVLFSDVRGFTERSEKQNADTLIKQLNDYLAAMVEVIFEYSGTVDKFIGDAIMATWGSLREIDLRENACAAALAMEKRLAKLNQQWKDQGLEPFHVGTGLHYGSAIVGEVGSDQRTDFTVIGDAVNLASRIESLTKTLVLCHY